jgi:MFS family permease
LSYEFQVSLPVLASKTFHGGPETYGFLTAFMGIGAVMGGLVTATRGRIGARPLIISVLAFGVALTLVATAPVLALAYVFMALVGWGSVSFMATGNSTLQLTAAPSMRGRVMALWAVAFMGSTPVGGPLIGWVIAVAGARVGLGVGAGSCAVAAVLGVVVTYRLRSSAARRQHGAVVAGTGGLTTAPAHLPAGP